MSRQRTASYAVEYHKGLISANEYAMVIRPRLWSFDQSAPAAIYCPALSAGGFNMTGWGPATELAKRGFAVVASDLGDTPTVPFTSGLSPSVGGQAGNTGGPGVWGNSAALTKPTAVYNFIQNVLKAKPVVALMGGSHGAAAATLWAAQNPTLVGCLLLAIGCVDIQDILTNNRGVVAGTSPTGYAQSIQTAWGLGSGTTLPANSTGVSVAASIACPVLDYYSDTDPISVPATQTAFQAANPSKITLTDFGSVGHSLTGFPSSTAADWVLSQVS